MKNIWKDAVMGVVVGDALGCPVQFTSRKAIASRSRGKVTTMEGHGTFDLPSGSWTDDSSMTLAAMDSMIACGSVDLDHIMHAFIDWLDDGKYTPYGFAYDVGFTCSEAIEAYQNGANALRCGKTGEYACGNGSLMRIIPAVLYAYTARKRDGISDEDAIAIVESVAALTHNHKRAHIACGIYFFMACEILDRSEIDTLTDCLVRGMNKAAAFYADCDQLSYYDRLRDLRAFAAVPEQDIRCSGYVVPTLETAVWSLLNTHDLAECLLTCVNIGEDTDTSAAIAGGLAGLFYSYDGIPSDWLAVIKRLDYIENLCAKANDRFGS